MLSNIVMKDPLFAAWKNSSQPKIGQFELLRSMRYSFPVPNSSGSLLDTVTRGQ